MERFFHLKERGTTVSREVLGGFATFMTMAYIIFVNPAILSGAGMPFPAVVAATCLGAAVPTILMGLWANYPIALASGMGLNAALVAYALKPGMNWQTMMGVVVVEGFIITILVLTNAREAIMNMIPMNLKRAISVGIGIFIAFLGMQQIGLVAKGPVPAVFLTHGDLTSRTTLIGCAGVLITAVLLAYRVRGALLLGIVGTTAIAFLVGKPTPDAAPFVKLPASLMAMPDFSTFGKADIAGALKVSLIGVIFAFLITDFFDTMGSVIGVAGQAGLMDDKGRMPRLNRVLAVDSLAAMWGGICGASSVTTYIESAAGVSEGGRTGLVCIVTGGLFLLALFFSPVIGMVPAVATAPALLVVGFLMMTVVQHIEFADVEEGIPAFLTLLLIPLGQSISYGIGMGFISFTVLKVLRGKGREVSPWLYVIAGLFLAEFIWAH